MSKNRYAWLRNLESETAMLKEYAHASLTACQDCDHPECVEARAVIVLGEAMFGTKR